MSEEAREKEGDQKIRIAGGVTKARSESSFEKGGLERLAGNRRRREPNRKQGATEPHGMDGRRVLHSKNLLFSRDPADESRLVTRRRERLKMELGTQAVAREARSGKARNEKDGLHAGGRARCQRDGARSARPAARAHIESDATRSATDTGGTSGG